MGERVRVDGRFFAVGDRRFDFRGVTYGTFAPRGDGARFPERNQLKLDLAAMSEAGFTVVRTYTAPSDDVLDLAADWGLQLLAGEFFADWRYMLGASRREVRRIARRARAQVREAAHRLTGTEQVLGLCLGNEVPADVLRWLGTDVVADTIRELVDTVREVDDGQLVTYANYPTAEYLPLECLDFLTFNVFLERQGDLRRYLTRLQHLAGDRPLVLGELGIDAGEGLDGERRQAEVLDWQLETVVERGAAGACVFSWTDEWWVGGRSVDGWHFGLTRADRSPRPALDTVEGWNRRSVRDLDFPWPSLSVVICAFNAAATLDECLHHTCALEYPGLEILVIDDGSTDATADIARRFPRVELITVPHGGLAVARNEGFWHAKGDLIAYLDSDAYPSPEWPFYLALAFDSPTVGGAGGPNVPPADDPLGAHMVARAPGGPVHVLISDDRAEHVPGCNMAFWRKLLVEMDGFDPIYEKAGDDVDLCWKLLDRDWEIGFHPAALVWHHRRTGLRAYLRQQRGYGRSEALVEARHPDRFTPAGTARWRGRIYNSLMPPSGRERVYRGIYGTAAYQSVYRGGGHLLDLVHQVGVPIATVLLATTPLALVTAWLTVPALLAATWLIVLAAVDTARASPPRGLRQGRLRFRLGVALHHVLQPLVRSWDRVRARQFARRDLVPARPLPAPACRLRGGVLVLPQDRPRADVAVAVIDQLRRRGVRVVPASGWEDYDARVLASAFVYGDLLTSGHPEGFVQLRLRPRLRTFELVSALTAASALGLVSPPLAALVLIPAVGEVVRGLRRSRSALARAIAATIPAERQS